jgi:hypothetical protein
MNAQNAHGTNRVSCKDSWGETTLRDTLRSFLLVVVSLLLLGSAARTFGQSNPVPFVNLPLRPAAAVPGSPGFRLTVNGTNFVNGSVVNWNGGALVTTFVSNSQLTAPVPASSLAAAATALVTVSNPGPGGGTSNVAMFDITIPVAATPGSLGPQTWIGFTRTDLPAGSKPSAIIAGDFNGNGQLDLAVANQDSNTVSVLVGNGDGTFQGHVDYNVGTAPLALAAGDFNGDGHLDIAVVNSGANTVSILLGNGDGTFQQPAQAFSVGNTPQWVAVGDFNGDGNLDLAVPNFADNTVSILLGKGDGTFPTHADIAVGSGPSSVAIGDFNRDGKLDLAVANYNANTVGLLLGNGNGTFRTGSLISNLKSLPHSVTVGDFDGDGILDLAIANTGTSVPGGTTVIAYGKGDGTFPQLFGYSTGNSPTMELTADLNGDGILDLITDNLSVLSKYTYLTGTGGRSQQSFQFHINIPTGTGPLAVTVGDFNNDGMLDVAAADSQEDTVSIMTQVPAVQVSPTSLTFGNWPVGTTSNLQKVTITNNSAESVVITSTVPSGDFVVQHPCKSVGPIGPNNSCTFQVAFAPTAVGVRSGSLAITDSFNSSPLTVSLTGTGVPQVSLQPASTNFGNIKVGSQSAARNFTVVNNLSTAITISSITATSTPSEFSQTNTCGTGLAAKGRCSIRVTFAPIVAGQITGSLSVNDSAADSPQTAVLLGTGVN